jgi:hypothetical protein
MNHPFLLWADSKISFGLVESTYNLRLPFLIGKQYFFSEKMSANSGWIGSGYAQFGFTGMIAYALSNWVSFVPLRCLFTEN